MHNDAMGQTKPCVHEIYEVFLQARLKYMVDIQTYGNNSSLFAQIAAMLKTHILTRFYFFEIAPGPGQLRLSK
jgi:hypothetical protein